MTEEEKISAIKLALSDVKFANLSDDGCSAAMNSVDPDYVTVKLVDTRCSTARGIVMAANLWPTLGLGAQTPGPLQGLCFTVYEALIRQEWLSTSEPQMMAVIEQTMSACVTNNILTRPVVDMLLALAHEQVDRSWADVHVEGRFVSPSDVAQARL